MFYELGAVCVGYDEWNFVRRRTLRMDRAGGRWVKNGLINFLHHRNGALRFRPNYDTVGMKEVADRGAFTEKFRVGDDVEFSPFTL